MEKNFEQQERERFERIITEGFHAEEDCKHYYNDELTRAATAILEEDFEKFPFDCYCWKKVMKKDRIEQLERAKALIIAEISRIDYCRCVITGRKELVKGVYIDES